VRENELSATPRTKHRRLREQGRSDRADLFAVLEAGFIAHLGLIADGAPMVVPTSYGFDEENLFVHGSVASQSLQYSGDSLVCVTITLVDGLVLARSVFEHGVNYRSAMIYGPPRLVTDKEEKLYGLRCLSEHMVPGQWEYVRQPSRKELAATTLLAVRLDEASVKVRSGPPSDADSPDAELGLWAGELPLIQTWDGPRPDPELPGGIKPPPHIADRSGKPAFEAPRLLGLLAGQGKRPVLIRPVL
jgi:uncharacterized protein